MLRYLFLIGLVFLSGIAHSAKLSPACLIILEKQSPDFRRSLRDMTETILNADALLHSSGEEIGGDSFLTASMVMSVIESFRHLNTLVTLREYIDRRRLTNDEMDRIFISPELDMLSVQLKESIKNISNKLLIIKNNGFRDEQRALRDKLQNIQGIISPCY